MQTLPCVFAARPCILFGENPSFVARKGRIVRKQRKIYLSSKQLFIEFVRDGIGKYGSWKYWIIARNPPYKTVLDNRVSSLEACLVQISCCKLQSFVVMWKQYQAIHQDNIHQDKVNMLCIFVTVQYSVFPKINHRKKFKSNLCGVLVKL